MSKTGHDAAGYTLNQSAASRTVATAAAKAAAVAKAKWLEAA